MNLNSEHFQKLLRHEIKIVWENAVRCWETFGLRKYTLRPLFIRPSLLLINYFSFLLDNAFYGRHKEINVQNPIFITGHPRSGTTFLHRLLSQSQEFVCFEFWHTMVPSLVARTFLSPIIRFIEKKGKDDLLIEKSGHYISLSSIEEEELLLAGCGNSPMVSLFLGPAFGDDDYWDLFYFEEQNDDLRNETIHFLKACFKRQIYYLGREQILGKMPYAMLRYKTLLEVFPDAKFIYLIRSPHEVIPSYLSLIRELLDKFWGLNNIPSSRLDVIYNRLYEQSIRYYRWVETLENQGLLYPNQFMTISYSLLKTDLTKVLTDILDFTGLNISDHLLKVIQQQAEKQKTYSREHQNKPLEDFGFFRDRITRDFSFVIERYGFEK
jgi:omega-hydroxy-beta-dihydromenaquinone-9 sulfotransferase